MPGYELATYEPAQRGEYLRLLEDAWGDLALTGPEFDWWFRENPAGSLMSVALMQGRVVGVAAHSLFRMAVGEKTVLGSFSAERAEEWTRVLFAMRYDNPAHREMMDLEGLKAWLPGRTTGYADLEAAVVEQGFFEPAPA